MSKDRTTTSRDSRDITIFIERERLRDPEMAEVNVGNYVYQLLVAIFEWGGEDNRRPDGTRVLDCHGHSVAQGLADTVVARWKQYETKTEEGA